MPISCTAKHAVAGVDPAEADPVLEYLTVPYVSWLLIACAPACACACACVRLLCVLASLRVLRKGNEILENLEDRVIGLFGAKAEVRCAALVPTAGRTERDGPQDASRTVIEAGR